VQRFFKDINEQYDDKLGFESKTEKLRVEVNRLYQEEGRLRTELLLLPLVGPALVRLTQRGVKEEDIVAIAELFKTDDSNSSMEEMQLTQLSLVLLLLLLCLIRAVIRLL
jgi:hypothetical protein